MKIRNKEDFMKKFKHEFFKIIWKFYYNALEKFNVFEIYKLKASNSCQKERFTTYVLMYVSSR